MLPSVSPQAPAIGGVVANLGASEGRGIREPAGVPIARTVLPAFCMHMHDKVCI